MSFSLAGSSCDDTSRASRKNPRGSFVVTINWCLFHWYYTAFSIVHPHSSYILISFQTNGHSILAQLLWYDLWSFNPNILFSFLLEKIFDQKEDLNENKQNWRDRIFLAQRDTDPSCHGPLPLPKKTGMYTWTPKKLYKWDQVFFYWYVTVMFGMLVFFFSFLSFSLSLSVSFSF